MSWTVWVCPEHGPVDESLLLWDEFDAWVRCGKCAKPQPVKEVEVIPAAVTDEMVKRAAEAWYRQAMNVGPWKHAPIRAALEAALSPEPEPAEPEEPEPVEPSPLAMALARRSIGWTQGEGYFAPPGSLPRLRSLIDMSDSLDEARLDLARKLDRWAAGEDA